MHEKNTASIVVDVIVHLLVALNVFNLISDVRLSSMQSMRKCAARKKGLLSTKIDTY